MENKNNDLEKLTVDELVQNVPWPMSEGEEENIIINELFRRAKLWEAHCNKV